MTRSSNTKIFTPFDNPERQFHTRKNTTPFFVHNIYSFYESESSKSEPESKEMGVIDIETLTLEQYLALERGNTIRKEQNPEDENYEIKAILQNELPPKEKDPGSFILPCVIGNTTISNALADLGASISVIPFSMFKRLGIVENGLVKIHNFIFPDDFVLLDIIEDDKVTIILGRPMLATTHAKIDVFRKKISLEVGTEQIVFNASEGTRSLTVLLVCIINDYQVIDDLGDPECLEEDF
ncbi:hypothetical protein Tco_0790774 [Tanacetum coccineum]